MSMKEINKEIFFYKSECGDAARIRYLGTDGEYHNIFIDSGYKRTFKNIISKHINEIQVTNEMIDLWVVSHIHDDHIGGIQQFVKQIELGQSKDTINKWFYNCPRRTNLIRDVSNSPSNVKSIRQADIFSGYLNRINKIAEEDIVSSSIPIDFFGLQVHILAPSIKKLGKLRAKYESDLGLPLEKFEGETISEAKAVVNDDYYIKLGDFDLYNWDEDDSVENGSSISILTDYKGIKTLWLADSHPSDIVTSLTQMGYSKDNKIKCELVKVSHHGSKGNNSDELYNLIDCCNYLFSADGKNKHKLPTKESIARILRNEHRNMLSTYNIYFTYDNNVLRSIFSNEKESVFKELNFSPIFSNELNYLKFEY
jgi:beta-lactamase superfamily II metal-dependent hydrolase